MYTLAYYLVYSVLYLLSLLPFRVLYLLADGLYFLVYYIFPYRKKVVFQNIQNSFPHKSPAEVKRIAKKFYRHFCGLLLEVVKLISISEKELKSRIYIKNPEIVAEMHKKGISCIGITSHFGNWEWFSGVSDFTDNLVLSVYKPLSNKKVEETVTKCRTRFGPILVPMANTVKTMFELKNSGKLFFALFIADQTPTRANIQYWTKFLNQETPVFLGAEKIARKLNLGLVFVKMNVIKRGYYEVEFVHLYDSIKHLPEFEATEAHVHELEKLIVENPQYWLWTHRRWKHKPKVNE